MMVAGIMIGAGILSFPPTARATAKRKGARLSEMVPNPDEPEPNRKIHRRDAEDAEISCSSKCNTWRRTPPLGQTYEHLLPCVLGASLPVDVLTVLTKTSAVRIYAPK
jgi:hypothetical protein